MILHNAENEITEKQNDDEVEHEAWAIFNFTKQMPRNYE